MTIKDLDNNIHNWHLTGNMSHGNTANKSSLHLRVRQILTTNFPTLQILEEVPIPLRKSETLYLDFYMPLIKTCVEVHGEQHYKFVAYYHNNQFGFIKQKKRDKDKKEWCETNGIKYIDLALDKTDEEWEKQVKNAY